MKWLAACIFINIAIVIGYYTRYNFSESYFSNIFDKQIPLQKKSLEYAEKWIVITTISYPTNDIMEMSKFKDWKIVIVADKKTPKNWTAENCVFLSLDVQQKLNYKILTFLPFNSYTRKMIGYLYAIENGAKFIYDTDDDNLPIKSGLDSFQYKNYTSGLICQKTLNDNSSTNDAEFYNTYSHFGRSDIWPRGFPLQFITRKSKTDFKLCETMKSPIIQQGLVNRDPDVDAIYRMIFVKSNAEGLNVKFDPFAPPITLDEKVYCPFNSQNTLFHYDAFWALLLPTTVTFRVADIWRSYWAQRLLHLTGNRLGFYGPNARQSRNPHSYFKDYLDEEQLYTESADFVKSMQKWECTSFDFQTCIIDLSQLLLHNKFWEENDIQLTRAWISDLNDIGYQFPVLVENNNASVVNACRHACFASTLLKENEIKTLQVDNLMKLNKMCDSVNVTDFQLRAFDENLFSHTKNVILIVVFNTPYFANIPLLQTLYEIWFANVIFCGTFGDDLENVARSSSFFSKLWTKSSRFSYVHVTSAEISSGYYGYICLNRIIDLQISNANGFLVIADDMLLNFWNAFDNNNVYFGHKCFKTDNWHHWKLDYGRPALERMYKYLNENLLVDLDSELLVALKEILLDPICCISDIYYIPSSLVKSYTKLSQLFFDHKVFLELAVPRILYLLGWGNTGAFDQLQTFNDSNTIFQGTYWWHYEQGGESAYPYYNKSHTFLHTVKLSYLEKTTLLNSYCRIYIDTMMKSVNNANE